MIVDYCRYHLISELSSKDRKQFDDKYIRQEIKILCQLASAADALDVKPLVELSR